MNKTIENLRNNAGLIRSCDFNYTGDETIQEKSHFIQLTMLELHDCIARKYSINANFLVSGSILLNMLSLSKNWSPWEEEWQKEFLYKKTLETQETYDEIKGLAGVGKLQHLTGSWLCHHFLYHVGQNEIVIGDFEMWDQPEKWGRIQFSNFIV
jgi:hypothetical protein